MVAPAFVSIGTHATGSAQTLAVGMPAGLVTGPTNIIVVILGGGGTFQTHATFGAPVFTGNNMAVYFKRVVGGEAGSYTFSTSTLSTITQGVAIQYSGVIGTGSPFDGAGFINGQRLGNTNSTILAITTSGADRLNVYADQKNASRVWSSGPAGMTLRSPGTGVQHIFDQPQPVAGGSGNKEAVFTVGANHFNVLFALTPDLAQTVEPDGTELVLTAGEPTVVQSESVFPDGTELVLTSGVPTLLVNQTVEPTGTELVLTPGTPTILVDQTVEPAGTELVLTPGTPSVWQQQTVQPDSTQLVLSAGTPTLVPDQLIQPDGTELVLVAGEPTLVTTLTVEPDGTELLLVPGTPTIVVGDRVQPDGTPLTLIPGVPTISTQLVFAGTVFNHETGATIAGATIRLFDDNDVLIGTTTTGPDGSYVFYFTPPVDPNGYYTTAQYMDGPTQVHGISDRGCVPV